MLHVGSKVPGGLISWLNLGWGTGHVHLPCAVGSGLTPDPSLAESLRSLCGFELCFCSVRRDLAFVHTHSVCGCILFAFLAGSAFNDTCVKKNEKHLPDLIFLTSLEKLFSMENVSTHRRRQSTVINLRLPVTWVLTFCCSYFLCASVSSSKM